MFTAESVQALREMMREGVEQEIAWGHYVIGDDIPGLNRQMISDYIRYLGNLRWTSLGYPHCIQALRANRRAWNGSASTPTPTWSRPISLRHAVPPTPRAPH